MKAYKVTKSIFKYWKTAYNSGHDEEIKYFLNEENAKKWGADGLDKMWDINNKLVDINAEYKKGYFKIEEIEVIE